MTQEDYNFISQEIRPVFAKWKETQVLKMTPEQNVKFREIYLQEMGRPLPTCGNCVVEGMLSMIIRSEHFIEAATIADDEQKPKRKRRKRIESNTDTEPSTDSNE